MGYLHIVEIEFKFIFYFLWLLQMRSYYKDTQGDKETNGGKIQTLEKKKQKKTNKILWQNKHASKKSKNTTTDARVIVN